MTVWLLGDQLNADAAPLSDGERVLLVEAHGFAARRPYHPQKLTLLFAAMRRFRDELRDAGHEVVYLRAERFGAALDEYFDRYPGDELTLMRPASHGAVDRLRELVGERGGELSVVPNALFLTTPAEFDAWAAGRDGDGGFRQEDWYRHVRRETGYLTDGDDPVGGEWNYDEENRETPPEDWRAPPTPTFEDEYVAETASWVRERFDGWGNDAFDPAAFPWPASRADALRALDHFVEHRLPEFGPYQDAMLDDEWALAHSLLSSSLNLGLLRPAETVEAAVEAYETGDAPIHSVEGFVRQVIGWREYMRHVYRREMPAMGEANQLGLDRDLPPAYWASGGDDAGNASASGDDTDMRCLSAAVSGVWERGYAHHIERLMVLSNFALLYGADPHELNEWFHAGFVDAYHWVTTPNVVGMGTFATDVLSSKPYAASGNYVNRMSDHCADCPYAVSRTTGEGACPFNALYWDFLAEHEERLRGTGRMGLVYSHLDDKRGTDLAAIRDRAADLRERAADGDL
ncbi:MAG: cryptochrome/photolyase family protein [Haloferacaceae archaeon]